MNPAFDLARFEARRRALGVTLGADLTALAETSSTNDLALEAASRGAPHGATFVADLQTKGRGRRGHAWTSPPGENLTFSVLLRPDVPAERVSALTLVVGLAVRAAAAARLSPGVPLEVKWPNDVVVGRRKVAGILVESRLVGAQVDAVVVGIGLNVHMREPPEEIREIATSLALLGEPEPSREDALASTLRELEGRLGLYTAHGLSPMLEELRASDALRNQRVRVGEIAGVGAGIDVDGALLLADEAGRVTRVTSGTVERI